MAVISVKRIRYARRVVAAFGTAVLCPIWASAQCLADQSEWIYRVGAPLESLAATADQTVIDSGGFEDWEVGDGSLTRIARLSGLPGRVTGGKMTERFVVASGGDVEMVVLGNFANMWPFDSAKDMRKVNAFIPTGTGGRSHTSDLAIASYFMGLDTADMMAAMNAPDFSGEIIYFTPVNAGVEYIELRLCSDAPPPPPPSPPESESEPEPEAVSSPPQPGLEPVIIPETSAAIPPPSGTDIAADIAAIEAALPAPPPRPKRGILWGILIGLSLLAAGLAVLLGKAKSASGAAGQLSASAASGAREQLGMVFAGSTMRVRAMGKGHPTRRAYEAVGRVGFAQVGKPRPHEVSYGSAVLVSPTEVMTNRHVWEVNKEALQDAGGTTIAGVEFMGVKHKAGSDFYRFDGPPRLLPRIDAVIFTFVEPVTGRMPMVMEPVDPETLDGRDIIVIGYPAAPHYIRPEVKRVTERFRRTFGVKRWSKGRIFRHSVDVDPVYGVEAAVNTAIDSDGAIRAICHNASTLGGSSGSAVVDAKTGAWLALHFGANGWYQKAEAANFAIPICDIIEAMEA